MKKLLLYFFLVVLSFKACYAYLDPGIGSQMIQIIIGAIFTGGLTIKIFWRKIINFLAGRKTNKIMKDGQRKK